MNSMNCRMPDYADKVCKFFNQDFHPGRLDIQTINFPQLQAKSTTIIVTLFLFFLFFHSGGQVQTIKIRKPPHVSICELDTGVISVDTILKHTKLKIVPDEDDYKITGYFARINDDVHMSWWECKGDRFCPDLVKEIVNTDRNKMTHLRIYDIIVIGKNGDTIQVNSIGLLLK